MEEDELETKATQAGGMASLVEHFSIEGLYGYRSVSLSSKYAATVLIAKNGSGKTTLLGALDAFLKGQFTRLNTLQFSTIKCQLRGVAQLLVLEKTDVDAIMQLTDGSDVLRVAKIYEIDPVSLLEFVESDYSAIKSDFRELHESAVFQKIYTKQGYSVPNSKAILDQLETGLTGRNKNIDLIRKSLKTALADIEVVYLPTYRRIELSLPEQPEDHRSGRRRPSIQARLGIHRRGLHAGDIQFGLSDIEARLAKLNQDMLFESNQGYREVSANIINDLISGSFERESPSLEERPSKEALNLFFARIVEGRRRLGPYSDVEIPDFDRIYSGQDIPENSTKFLTYFLGKLNTVMQKTRDVEGVVEEFIHNCNRYLSAQDESVNVPGRASRQSSFQDDKVLKLDRRNLKVSVSSLSARRKIPLDALSSGEKQMISLFARLYLYPGRKIVLIDEPELSLSIDWQRKILLDIVNAPSCVQVVAITHSPFVFDNELEPYATPLRLKVDTSAPLLPESDDEDEVNE